MLTAGTIYRPRAFIKLTLAVEDRISGGKQHYVADGTITLNVDSIVAIRFFETHNIVKVSLADMQLSVMETEEQIYAVIGEPFSCSK